VIFHCTLRNLVSGSWWWTQVSSQWWCDSRRFHLYGCTTLKDCSRCTDSCTYALLSDVLAPTLRTQECHALKDSLYPHWCQAVMQFLLVLHSLLLPWIMALPASCFLTVADVDSCHMHLESITFVKLFLNISIQSHTLQCDNVLSPYWALKMVRISAPLTPSAHKILRHISALLWWKLKDTLTCPLLHS
jgi:hypothetical protein